MSKSWKDLKDEVAKEISKIESLLEKDNPKNITDVLSAVKKIVPDWGVIPNPNRERQYIQILLSPPNGFTCSFSVSKYNIYTYS